MQIRPASSNPHTAHSPATQELALLSKPHRPLTDTPKVPKPKGGKRPGAGRKKRIVEDASQSVLFALFDEKAEREATQRMIQIAKTGEDRTAIAAYNSLMDRKYGKATEKVKQDTTGETHVIVEYVNGNA